jgi:hypothetical protein
VTTLWSLNFALNAANICHLSPNVGAANVSKVTTPTPV